MQTHQTPLFSREEWCLLDASGGGGRGGVSIQEGCCVVGKGGGEGEEGASLCYYVSVHRRGTLDLFCFKYSG